MKTIFLVLFAFSMPTFASSVSEQFALSPTGQFTQALTTGSVQYLPHNINRGYLFIQNNSAINVYLKFGSTITSTEYLIIPAGGGSVEYLVAPRNSVWLEAASGTPSVTIIEGNL